MKVNHEGYEGSYKFLTIPVLSTPFQKKIKKQTKNSKLILSICGSYKSIQDVFMCSV